jgi:hypothetical protein
VPFLFPGIFSLAFKIIFLQTLWAAQGRQTRRRALKSVNTVKVGGNSTRPSVKLGGACRLPAVKLGGACRLS